MTGRKHIILLSKDIRNIAVRAIWPTLGKVSSKTTLKQEENGKAVLVFALLLKTTLKQKETADLE